MRVCHVIRIKSIFIELVPHNLILPGRKNLEYTLSQLADTIDVDDFNIDDSIVLDIME